MADLFATPRPRAGYGAAMFLADLAEGVPDQAMRVKWKAGDYPNVCADYAQDWRALAGRITGTAGPTKEN